MNGYPRYGIYYAPTPGSRWWRFGCDWLSYDAISGCAMAPTASGELSREEIARLIAVPRRYGFHATLKAPFALAVDANATELHRALADFAREQTPLDLGPLHLRELDGFLALCPETTPALQAFAQRCVERFDRFRAPPSEVEVARRRRAPLTPRQLELLDRWGYPYVAEEFRMHFTLTGRLEADRRGPVRAALASMVHGLADEELHVDALCLFEQAAENAPFRLLRRCGFDGSVTRYERGAEERPGRLFYLVGPSGAGKDALLRYARPRLIERPVVFAHRYITRPADSGGENHVALDAQEFQRRLQAGLFAMAWESHGHAYGIGIEVDHWMAQGLDVIVNGSRAYLPQAHARYPEMTVIWISAAREVLQARLAARGRENAEATARRLARAETFAPPQGMPVVAIRNDGALTEAGDQLLRVLTRGTVAIDH